MFCPFFRYRIIVIKLCSAGIKKNSKHDFFFSTLTTKQNQLQHLNQMENQRTAPGPVVFAFSLFITAAKVLPLKFRYIELFF